MKKRNVIILVAVALLIATGLVGYETWRERKQLQAPIDAAGVPGCDICSVVKRDLAEQVKERKQQSEQTNGSSPSPP